MPPQPDRRPTLSRRDARRVYDSMGRKANDTEVRRFCQGLLGVNHQCSAAGAPSGTVCSQGCGCRVQRLLPSASARYPSHSALCSRRLFMKHDANPAELLPSACSLLGPLRCPHLSDEGKSYTNPIHGGSHHAWCVLI
jgi:hypothetical protein